MLEKAGLQLDLIEVERAFDEAKESFELLQSDYDDKQAVYESGVAGLKAFRKAFSLEGDQLYSLGNIEKSLSDAIDSKEIASDFNVLEEWLRPEIS